MTAPLWVFDDRTFFLVVMDLDLMETFASSLPPWFIRPPIVDEGEKGVVSGKFGMPGIPPTKLIVLGTFEKSPFPALI